MRLLRRILASLFGWLAAGSLALLATTLFVCAWTRQNALIAVEDTTSTEVAVRQGSLYWKTSHQFGGTEPGDFRGFLLTDPGWRPLEGTPPPSARRFGFASVEIAVPEEGGGVDAQGPKSAHLTIAPLGFFALLFSVPPAVWVARRLLLRRLARTATKGTAGRPVTFRNGIGGLVTALSVPGIFILAGGWVGSTYFWRSYELSAFDLEKESLIAVRSDAGDGTIQFALDEIPPDPPGTSRYGSTGLQIHWLADFWPPDAPIPRPGRHTFAWFHSTDLTRLPPQWPSGSIFGGTPASAPSATPSPPPSPVVYGHRWDVPYWFLVLVTATPVALRVRTLRRRSCRASAGLCQCCGYDLRASPGRCPECGLEGQRRLLAGSPAGGGDVAAGQS